MVSEVSLSLVPSTAPDWQLSHFHLVPGSVGLPMQWPQEAPPASSWWPSAEVLDMGIRVGSEGVG